MKKVIFGIKITSIITLVLLIIVGFFLVLAAGLLVVMVVSLTGCESTAPLEIFGVSAFVALLVAAIWKARRKM